MLNTHTTILASMFLREVKEFPNDAKGRIKCPPAYKRDVIHTIACVLASGTVSPKMMEDLFTKAKTHPEREGFYKPTDVCDAFQVAYQLADYQNPDNLLEFGRFYYHPRLHVTPPPPVLIIEDDGTMTASYDNEPFYLEITDTLTKKDLLGYFYGKRSMPPVSSHYARDMGAIEHLLKFYDVDFLLYLIDEAFALARDTGRKDPANPLDLQDAQDEAEAVYEARKKRCYEEGLDRVIPRPIS